MANKHWKHDCDRCRFLGSTIGGGRMTDLYVCGETLIARYGSDGPEYYSTTLGSARPEGHAELLCVSAVGQSCYRDT